jgi:hypothetical protein
VLILKGVEVVCFDTLLQVLILKVDMGRSRLARETRRGDRGERKPRERITLPSRLGIKRRRESRVGAETERNGVCHPGCFAKRGCKLLKTNNGGRKKRGKRLPFAAQGKQEAASS